MMVVKKKPASGKAAAGTGSRVPGSPLRVLVLAAEAAPYAKAGGLGDVIGALPSRLAELGVEPVVVLPFYREVRMQGHHPEDSGAAIRMFHGGREQTARILVQQRGQVRHWFIDNPEYFDRDGIYGPPGGEFGDSAERYGFLARGAIAAARAMKFRPHVVHCHDWHTALAPLYLRAEKGPGAWAGVRTILTIHNLAYQGGFGPQILPSLGIPTGFDVDSSLGFGSQVNFLRAGIAMADLVTTVSPAYAREILTPEMGFGLDDVLLGRGEDLRGILNGIDYDVWDPESDAALPRRFGVRRTAARRENAEELRRELGLYPASQTPLFAFVGRLVQQKGVDLLVRSIPALVESGCQLAVLGSGEFPLEESLRAAALSYPGRVSVTIGFNDVLGRRLYGGSDFFVMPSRFEPCGLGQMIAMRYGSLPVVRATGGLRDTVVDIDQHPEAGCGFVFEEFTEEALTGALMRAVDLFRKGSIDKYRKRVMSLDHSWKRSARDYLDLYRSLRQAKRGG